MDTSLGAENTKRLAKLASQEPIGASTIEKDIASADPSTQLSAALHLIADAPDSPADSFITSLNQILKYGPQKADDSINLNLSEAVLAALSVLSSKGTALEDEALLFASAFTNSSDAWTTEAAAKLASSLLMACLPPEKQQDFITSTVLQGYLRPIFSKSSGQSGITASGRPSAFREPPQTAARPPAEAAWKEAGPQAVTTFQWAVQHADETTLAKNWPLFIPVLVTLCEDNETAFRLQGLGILNSFLQKCPIQIIRSSGVDAVFQEAVFPTLLFLPNLTPEEESAQLLRAAYKVLLSLSLIDSEVDAKKRVQLLDKVLREGVFTGYFHASQHIHLVKVILESMADVVNGLQIAAVKHLQKLLNLCSSLMTDSFALAYPPTVLAAAKALNTIIVNCWPRIASTQHAEQVIHITSIAWTNLQDHPATEYRTELDSLAKELTQSSNLLAALWRQSGQAPPPKLFELLKQQPELQPLFDSLDLKEGLNQGAVA